MSRSRAGRRLAHFEGAARTARQRVATHPKAGDRGRRQATSRQRGWVQGEPPRLAAAFRREQRALRALCHLSERFSGAGREAPPRPPALPSSPLPAAAGGLVAPAPPARRRPAAGETRRLPRIPALSRVIYSPRRRGGLRGALLA